MTDPALVTFIHLSDTHIHAEPGYTGAHVDFSARPRVQVLVEHINNLDVHVDFILHTGDIMTDPEKAEDYQVAHEVLSQLKVPIHYVPGNHDQTQWLQKVMMGRTRAQITPTLDYTFEHNGVQVIMVDSNTMQPGGSGHLSDAQLIWLDNLCSAKDHRPLVVGVHHNVLPTQAPWLDSFMLKNGVAFHNTVLKAKHRLRGVFFGHIHENTTTVRDGIMYVSALSGWFQTRTYYNQREAGRDPVQDPGFNLVTLTERDTLVRYYRVPIPDTSEA